MKIILCINTSKKPQYAAVLDILKRQPWFIACTANPQIEVVEVYGDPSVQKATLERSILRVPVPDEYETLATKTYEMIKFFYERGSFDYLIKIDESTMQPLSMKRLCLGDYSGVNLWMNNERAIKQWAKIHQLHVDRGLPFALPYYGGSCYSCSYRACAVVVAHGPAYLPLILKKFGGIEDLFVGWVLDAHLFSVYRRIFLRVKALVAMVLRKYKSIISQ